MKKQRRILGIVLGLAALSLLIFFAMSRTPLPHKAAPGGIFVEEYIPDNAMLVAQLNDGLPLQVMNQQTRDAFAPFVLRTFLGDASDTEIQHLQQELIEQPYLTYVMLPDGKSAFFFAIRSESDFEELLIKMGEQDGAAIREVSRNRTVVERAGKTPQYTGRIENIAFVGNFIPERTETSLSENKEFRVALQKIELTKQHSGYLYFSQAFEALLPEFLRGNTQHTVIALQARGQNLVANFVSQFENIPNEDVAPNSRQNISEITSLASHIPGATVLIAAQNTQALLSQLPFGLGQESLDNSETQQSFFINKPFALVLESGEQAIPAFALFVEGADFAETKDFYTSLQRRIRSWVSAVNIVFKAAEDAPVMEIAESEQPYRDGLRFYLHRIPEEVSSIPLLRAQQEPVTFWYGLNFRNQLYFTTSTTFFEQSNADASAPQTTSLLDTVHLTTQNPDQLFVLDTKGLSNYIKRLQFFAETQESISPVQQRGLQLITDVFDVMDSIIGTSMIENDAAKGEIIFAF
ncbi:hypothetical protein COV82_03950 [Candidatus Peregrinibacteria bacterium CG11_big_fil_rev_8_21_14_0_20_46_8]|nr:MAG: hypothetical protein COV82_03950 [Candidatus Peregrinibacteria bacterium CG11_big_fil_rev_8_21_14_0_20_46_8]